MHASSAWEGLRQGDSSATPIFNVMVARVYRKLSAKLDGKGGLLALADNVKISAPPDVTGEIVDVFTDIAWVEAGLKTHTVKIMIYV